MEDSGVVDSFEAAFRAVAKAPAALVPVDALPPQLAAAAMIGGHYQVRRLLGRGGMGDVYLAMDTRLDRLVAVKVGRGLAAQSAQVVREARAIALVSHPNVVGVFEVGRFRDQPFIAMEYVPGQTAEVWAQRPRSWREVLHVYQQAARGLEAMHAAGLVHRDVKPDNVLVGEDARTRVVDFGLVRRAPVAPTSASKTTTDTMAGSTAVAGTAGFIAPEVIAGAVPDSRADQFALCVSVWRALHGASPAADTSAATSNTTSIGAPRPVDRLGNPVPGRVHRALRRGLSVDPADRFPSMSALGRELDASTHGWRKQRTFGLATVVAAGLLVLALPAERTRVCPAPAAPQWTAAQAASIRSAFGALDSPVAAPASERVVSALDGWHTEWNEARGQVCIAADVGVPPPVPTTSGKLLS